MRGRRTLPARATMRRRTKITISIVAVVLLLLAGALYLRKIAPPEVARLLPDSDGIIYLNLRPLRAATHFDEHPVPHDPDYQHFIDATGIHPEHDLDKVAFALERMPDPHGPNGPVAFSEVFQGHFTGGSWRTTSRALREPPKPTRVRRSMRFPAKGAPCA